MKKKFISLLALSLSCMVVLGGCGSKGSKGSSDKSELTDEQVLNLVYEPATTLDVNDVSDSASSTVLTAISEGLVRVKNDGSGDVMEEAGADSWETSKDGLTWTFKLKKGVKWSDGEEVVAQHYVDSVLRILDPEQGFGYAFLAYDIAGAENYNLNGGKVEDVAVKAVDDYTLEFKLAKQVPFFLSKISYTAFLPIRLDEVKELGDTYASDIANRSYNGPFKIESWDNGNSMTMVKNEAYWDAENVYLEKINFTKVDEAATRSQLLDANELDLTQAASGEYLDLWNQQAESGSLVALTGSTPSNAYFEFNTKSDSANGILSNAKIRKAIGLSIDVVTYVKDILKVTIPAQGIVPELMTVGDVKYRDVAKEPLTEDFKKYNNNTEEIQKLFKEGLKELGLQTDDLSKYEITLLSRSETEIGKQRVEWQMQQVSGKLGITVKNVVQADWGTYLKVLQSGEYDFTVKGWNADYNDPMSFLDIWVSGGGNNDTGYASKEYDELLKKASEETDDKKRAELYGKAENLIVNEDAVVRPIYYNEKSDFIKPYVKDMQYPAFGGSYDFKTAYVEGKE